MKRIDLYIDCLGCSQPFKITPCLQRRGRKTCSLSCRQKYLWSLPEYRKMQLEACKGRMPANIEWLKENAKTPEHREKIRMACIGKPSWNKGKKGVQVAWNKGIEFTQIKGEKHWKWKKDRSTLAKRQERNDVAYTEWRKTVCERDGWKCRIFNSDCKGRLEVHHILSWKNYENLRYELNNGITLCHFHHPKKRSEEVRLSPYFRDLISKEV